jgi:ferredoxin
MRECHPDLSQDEEESTEFAMVLNEIYETLRHPEQRAAYDAIMGISGDALNPFNDDSFPRNQVFVDEFSCIGCRNCTNVCPKTFALEDDFGRARAMQQNIDAEDMLQEAIDTCPVNCIYWVSAPQLALLENAMSAMERLDVWLLMSGNGNGRGVNVFNEARIRWEKRMAAIRARRLMQESKSRWAAWANVAGVATGPAAAASSMDDGSVPAARADPRMATAAAAAAAARRWRNYQRARRHNAERLHLPSGDEGDSN